MKIVKDKIKIEGKVDGKEMLKNIERYGRVCYKSEDKITEGSAEKFVAMILKLGHESVMEHEKITVRIICNRVVSQSIVRHRLASYSQESTRYCNYQKEKFGSEITVVEPLYWQKGSKEYKIWEEAMKVAEKSYFDLISLGTSPEEARDVLPFSLKTELIMSANLREWRHILKIRITDHNQPHTKHIFRMLLEEFQKEIPIIFDDIKTDS